MATAPVQPIPYVNPKVKAVGTSRLRTLRLQEIGDTIYLIQDKGVPLAVLLSYENYLRFQTEIHHRLGAHEIIAKAILAGLNKGGKKVKR